MLRFPCVEKIHLEALELLVEAREYAVCSRGDKPIPGKDIPWITGEKSRVTARLASVVAWVAYRRAMVSGEFEENDALRNLDDCFSESSRLVQLPRCEQKLPSTLQNLLERSHSLYVRALRINRMMRE